MLMMMSLKEELSVESVVENKQHRNNDVIKFHFGNAP